MASLSVLRLRFSVQVVVGQPHSTCLRPDFLCGDRASLPVFRRVSNLFARVNQLGSRNDLRLVTGELVEQVWGQQWGLEPTRVRSAGRTLSIRR